MMLKLQDKDLMMSTKDGQILTDCGVKSVFSLLFASLEQDKANTWQLKMGDLSKWKYTLLF